MEINESRDNMKRASVQISGVTRGGHDRAPPGHRLVLPGHWEKMMTTIFKEPSLF